MTSFIAAGGSGRSSSVIPAVPVASSVTTIAFIRDLPVSSSRPLADLGPHLAQPNAFSGSAVTRGIDEVLRACAATREDAELLGVEHPRQANRLCERRRERRRRLGH